MQTYTDHSPGVSVACAAEHQMHCAAIRSTWAHVGYAPQRARALPTSALFYRLHRYHYRAKDDTKERKKRGYVRGALQMRYALARENTSDTRDVSACEMHESRESARYT